MMTTTSPVLLQRRRRCRAARRGDPKLETLPLPRPQLPPRRLFPPPRALLRQPPPRARLLLPARLSPGGPVAPRALLLLLPLPHLSPLQAPRMPLPDPPSPVDAGGPPCARRSALRHQPAVIPLSAVRPARPLDEPPAVGAVLNPLAPRLRLWTDALSGWQGTLTRLATPRQHLSARLSSTYVRSRWHSTVAPTR